MCQESVSGESRDRLTSTWSRPIPSHHQIQAARWAARLLRRAIPRPHFAFRDRYPGGLFHGAKSIRNSATIPTTATIAATIIGIAMPGAFFSMRLQLTVSLHLGSLGVFYCRNWFRRC